MADEEQEQHNALIEGLAQKMRDDLAASPLPGGFRVKVYTAEDPDRPGFNKMMIVEETDNEEKKE